MLCYSFLDKRGDLIKKIINWMLKDNNEVIINNQAVECSFSDDIIIYNENSNINIIDIKNKTYKRENDEFSFTIDFKNKSFKYILKEKDYLIENKLTKAVFSQNKNIYNLIYSMDEEEKEIIIELL